MTETGELRLAQDDGGPPTTLGAGTAPGESGVSVISVRFRGGAHLSGTLRQHFICFQLSPRVQFECRIAGRAFRHHPMPGSIAICPAGVDWVADGDGSVDGLLVAVDPAQLAVAAAEESALQARLIERFSGDDPVLLTLARQLAREAVDSNPNGPLFWHQLGFEFIDRLVTSHTSGFEARTPARLSSEVLARIKEYIVAHLDESIEVAALAKLSGLSPFHFARRFKSSVGMTPHRFVVRLRLRRAVELIRQGRAGLGAIALQTGFADQSHLSRWVRRVYGVSPAQLLGQ